MDTVQWILLALLGISLAASTGLNTFLPLLMLAIAAHFSIGGTVLNGHFAWLATEPALIVLSIATVFEIVADKIPAVDHALDTAGFVIRPLAGAFATASVFRGADPMIAALAGLAIGAPTTLGFHTAKAAARVTSSAGTLGCANPFLSAVEDAIAFFVVLIGLFAPLFVPLVLAWALYVLYRLIKVAHRKAQLKAKPPPVSD